MEKFSNELLWAIKEEAKDFEELSVWLYYLWSMNRRIKSLIKKSGVSEEVKVEIRLPETDEEIEETKNAMEIQHLRWLPKFFLRPEVLHPAAMKNLRESTLEIKEEPFQETEWWNQFFKDGLLAFDLIGYRIDELKELLKKELRVTTNVAGADALDSSPESLYYFSIMAYFFSKLCQNFDVIFLEDKKDEVWNTFYPLYKDIKKRGYIFCGYHLSAIRVSMGKTKSTKPKTQDKEKNYETIKNLLLGKYNNIASPDFIIKAMEATEKGKRTIKNAVKKIREEFEEGKIDDIL